MDGSGVLGNGCGTPRKPSEHPDWHSDPGPKGVYGGGVGSHPFLLRIILLTAMTSSLLPSCSTDARELSWTVAFGPGAEASDAVRVQTRIIGGGCDGTTDLYVTSVTPGAPMAAAPGALTPGTYGFAASAIDDLCVPYASVCSEVTLPLPEGSEVVLVLASDSMARPGCRVDECVAGFCGGPPSDASIDAPASDAARDGSSDGGDGSTPPRPIVVAQGTGGSGALEIEAPTTAILIAAGMGMYRQADETGGFVASTFEMAGTRRAGTVVERVAAAGNDLYANSALVAVDLGLGALVEHVSVADGYDLTSESWAWGALAADSVWASEDRQSGNSASTSAEATTDVIAMVYGSGAATTANGNATLSLTVEVDGTVCASATHLGVNEANPGTAGASFFCLTALGPGTHDFDATLAGFDLSFSETTVSHVLIPRADVPVFGSTTDPSTSVRLPSAGLLIAFAAARFTETGPGWGDIAIAVDGGDCGRVRSEGAPTGLTATCVWPVSAGQWVTITAGATREGGVTPAGTTLGWAFFSSE